MKKQKKRLLILWNAHTFKEVIQPLIEKLTISYKIVIIIEPAKEIPYLIKILNEDLLIMKKENLIVSYYIIPPLNKRFSQHKYFFLNKSKLKYYNFDILLSHDEASLFVKLIINIILKKFTLKIIFWPTITYLFEDPNKVKNLFSKNLSKNNQKREKNLFEKIFELIKSQEHIRRKFYVIINSIYERIKTRYFLSKISFYFTFLPLIFYNKKLPTDLYDRIYRIGSGKSDAFIFCDSMEVEAHKILFNKSKIFEALYPTKGNCFCNNESVKKNSVLFPVSYTLHHDIVSEYEFDLYLRDIKIVLNEIGKDVIIHLRQHPLHSERKWIYNFRDLLNKNGIKSIVVENYRPIREVMCNYLGMIGFPSGAMRDAFNSCDFGFRIIFEKVGKLRYVEPKFIYGKGEGMHFINEDGTYNPRIFHRKKNNLPKNKTVLEIIDELSKNQNLNIKKEI